MGPGTNGVCDITAPYIARFGQPNPGQKVFIVTCQEKNGWKGQESMVSMIVPTQATLGEQQSNED